MNAREAIKLSLDTGQMISLEYLNDLNDQELIQRPCPGCNHINWQVGHLIVSEHGLLSKIAPGAMPALPDGFAERYTSDTATSDDPAQFCSKAALLEAYHAQRTATLAVLERTTDDELDKPTGIDYAPTVGSLLSMQGSHWLMHAGQWAVVRRQLGRKPLF